MSELVAFPTEDGNRILVEVTGEEEPELVRATKDPREIAVETRERFEQALNVITPTTAALRKTIEGLDWTPTGIEIEFGVKLSFKAGAAIIASAGADAHFKVTLTWDGRAAP